MDTEHTDYTKPTDYTLTERERERERERENTQTTQTTVLEDSTPCCTKTEVAVVKAALTLEQLTASFRQNLEGAALNLVS